MIAFLALNWWTLTLRGIAAVLFGCAALLWPGITAEILALLFGVFIFVDGVFSIIGAFAGDADDTPWLMLILKGILEVLIALGTFVWPEITLLTLLIFVAAWAMLSGVLEMVVAVRLRKIMKGEWVLFLIGILSVSFGIVLVLLPKIGMTIFTWLIGIESFMTGILLLILSSRLRAYAHRRPVHTTGMF